MLEKDEFDKDLIEITINPRSSGRREVADALFNLHTYDSRRLDPLFEGDIGLIMSAYNRLSTTPYMQGVDMSGIAKAISEMRRVGSKENAKKLLLNAAIHSMTTLTAGVKLIDNLTSGRGTTPLCDATRQILEGRQSFGLFRGRSSTIEPILLGNPNERQNQEQIIRILSPYRYAIILSESAKKVGEQSTVFDKNAVRSLGHAERQAKRINPGKSKKVTDELNSVLQNISSIQDQLNQQLGSGVDLVGQVGVQQLDSSDVHDNLQSAKQVGAESKELKNLIKKRGRLSKQIRNQLDNASKAHLAALNSISYSNMAELTLNIGTVGEIVARIALVDTTINATVTTSLALQAATDYLLHGKVDSGRLEKRARSMFSSSEQFKGGSGSTNFLLDK